jgi:L-amino acid N-acyltransferase YncA
MNILNIKVRAYEEKDLQAMVDIWNQVVDEGVAFPQEEDLNLASGKTFFAEQSFCAVALDTETQKIYGLYILHPNNIGRCGHICNASYAVSNESRGLHIGEKLVQDCLQQANKHGFKVLQFNAVVASNIHARHLYERLGFKQIGVIPEGFRMKDGHYEDICPYYHLV